MVGEPVIITPEESSPNYPTGDGVASPVIMGGGINVSRMGDGELKPSASAGMSVPSPSTGPSSGMKSSVITYHYQSSSSTTYRLIKNGSNQVEEEIKNEL